MVVFERIALDYIPTERVYCMSAAPQALATDDERRAADALAGLPRACRNSSLIELLQRASAWLAAAAGAATAFRRCVTLVASGWTYRSSGNRAKAVAAITAGGAPIDTEKPEHL